MSEFAKIVNQFIEEIQNGIDRYNDLYKKTYAHLKVVALNYLFFKGDVEDVLSKAYFKIFQYIKSADTANNCYCWMCKIVQHTAYEFNNNNEIMEDIDNVSANNLFCDIEEYILDRTDLMRAIRTLSDIEQRLIYLRFWEDLEYQEIAERFQQKENTINKKVLTILKKINKIMCDQDKP